MSSRTLLPEELLADIASYLSKEDLCAMRLSSKRLTASASYSLFSTVRLYPSPESIEKYYTILEHPLLSTVVRHVCLNTIEEDVREEHSGHAGLSIECRNAFGSFNRFPNLKSATLRFSSNATSGRTLHGVQFSNWPETTEFRRPILDQFFRTLADPAASNVRDISIRNIQNINDSELVKSKHFKDVISRLTSLRLFIATEHHEEDPEEDFQLPELYTFMDELVPTWLSPCSATLTRLALYSDQYFGYMPRLDLRGLHFPRLRTLALGNYIISHAWQLDWLAHHGPSLRHLYLDDCSIINYFQLYAPTDIEGYVTAPCKPYPDDLLHRPTIRTSSLRWAAVFDALRAAGTSLRTFRIGSSALGGWHFYRARRLRAPVDGDPSHPRVYERLRVGLFSDRYLLCHMGIGPSWYTDLGTLPWPEGFEAQDGDGSREGNEVMGFLEALDEGVVDRADKEALVRLVEGVGRRRREEEGGVDGEEEDVVVEGLMGRGWGWRDEAVYGNFGPLG